MGNKKNTFNQNDFSGNPFMGDFFVGGVIDQKENIDYTF